MWQEIVSNIIECAESVSAENDKSWELYKFCWKCTMRLLCFIKLKGNAPLTYNIEDAVWVGSCKVLVYTISTWNIDNKEKKHLLFY